MHRTAALLFLLATLAAASACSARKTTAQVPTGVQVPKAAQAVAQTVPNRPQPGVAIKHSYSALEVERFGLGEGVQFPADLVGPLQDDIVKKFSGWDNFKHVYLPSQTPTHPGEPVLRVTGTVVYFNKGSRGKRYIGFGMGAGLIVVRIAFADRATGAILVAEQISATLREGFFGGASENITREFAKTFLAMSKLLLEKPVPSSAGTVPSAEARSAPSGAERKVVTIPRGGFEQGQSELNANGSAGYRVVRITPTGARVNVAMERPSGSTGVYEYRVLHVHLVSNLGKDLNSAAAEGFRYVPRTLAWLTGGIGISFAIVEKSPSAPGNAYTYRVHSPLRISSAQKDIINDQRDGFDLVDVMKINNNRNNVVLMEKALSHPGP